MSVEPVQFEKYPDTRSYEKYISWLFVVGFSVASAVTMDNALDESSRCIADNANGWVDFHPVECGELIADYIPNL